MKYAVRCNGDIDIPDFTGCGLVELSEQEYTRQMSRPDSLWECPNCQSTAQWSDEVFEAALSDGGEGL